MPDGLVTCMVVSAVVVSTAGSWPSPWTYGGLSASLSHFSLARTFFTASPCSRIHQCLGRLSNLLRAQREAADAVVADRVDEELRPDELEQLAEVHLGDEHLLVAAQHVAGVPRERVDVAQVCMRDLL